MLQIQDISKEYRTENLLQKALDHVSLNLRDNEFVAILGPSGSGKTTLLNIIGGLDRYDSGDLIIRGISTRQYKDRDWDSYRNHTVGFVFQSYNLIPHQTILSNVELALTISGIGKKERRKRAVEALEQVGLGKHINKRPNQLSGGQMQRVAIARALVNDPDILLADEPTGALDSETSIQVMELLQQVAKDRLVVMVTHNPELAKQYATRIVVLKDGTIRSDTDPFVVKEEAKAPAVHKNMGKSSMSFFTAISLSFNNLRTKKARTLLTAFAGSIGIIGIALIQSLSTGVNAYIANQEEQMLNEYPLSVQSTSFDLTSMMGLGMESVKQEKEEGQIGVVEMTTQFFAKMDSNDLQSLKTYLDSEEEALKECTAGINYTYSVEPQIYLKQDEKIRQVNPDKTFSALGLGSGSSSSSLFSSMMSTNVFYVMPQNAQLYQDQYEIKAGRWPGEWNECVLVLTSNGNISDFLLYSMGLRDGVELDDMVQKFINGESVQALGNLGTYTYEDVLGRSFFLINSADKYQYDSEYKTWVDKSDDEKYMKELVAAGEELTIVGIVQAKEGTNGGMLTSGINYPASLLEHISEEAAHREIVQAQLAQPSVNVFTGEGFGEEKTSEDFDLASLFSVDEEALKNAFGFDSKALEKSMAEALSSAGNLSLDGTTLDLSAMMQPDQLSVTLPQAPSVSMGDVVSGIKITATKEDISTWMKDLTDGYEEYAKETPAADYSRLGEAFTEYLQTEEARQIIGKHLEEILKAGQDSIVTPKQVQSLITSILTGYREYAADMGYTDPERFEEYLLEYLETEDARIRINSWAAENIRWGENFTITKEQMEALTKDLTAGYQEYAASHDLPDPGRMEEFFAAYLKTEKAQKILADGVEKMIDTSGAQSILTSAMTGYMQQVFTAYGQSIASVITSQMTSMQEKIAAQLTSQVKKMILTAMTKVAGNMESMFQIDTDAFMNAFNVNMDATQLMELLSSFGSSQNATQSSNLQGLGYVDFSTPSSIQIYPKDFEGKAQVIALLDSYNEQMEQEGKEESKITYTDTVGTLMSSVTQIVDIISYVLIAVVAVSLVVSSIMIGVITYISVLERKKEIGILRAIGASKRNVSQVFNAETCIIGLCAGLLGVGITWLLLIPVNMVIHHLAGIDNINAILSGKDALLLVVISVVLTVLGGLIPSSKASRNDPVTALRTE